MFGGRPREYRSGRAIFTTSADADLLTKFQEITTREGKPMNRVLQDLMAQYVKTHAGGNPSFEIDKWIEQPEFIGDPALRETNDKWDRYLASCEEKDLQALMGVFQKRLQQTNQSWRKKKGFTK